MGNCLIRQNKIVIKVMKANGEVLEYRAPIKVHQVLTQHADHAISDGLPVVRHLHHQDDVDLLPLPAAALPESIKNHPRTTVVRIKLVVTKHELEVMLKKGGVSVGDLVSQIGKNGSLVETNDGRWKPGLEIRKHT